MTPDWLTSPRIRVLREPKDASRVGSWPQEPTLFLPITTGTYPLLIGIAHLVIDSQFFFGTPAEIQQALNTLEEQLSELPLTREDICAGNWGASFRTLDGRGLEAMQGPEHPEPEWEFHTQRQQSGVLHLEFRHEEDEP